MEHMSFYSLLGVFSTLVCMKMLASVWRDGSKKNEFILLFVTLIIMSLTQVGFFVGEFYYLGIARFSAHVFLISIYFFFAHLHYVSARLTFFPQAKPVYFYIAPVILVVLYANGLIIEGFTIEKNSILHVDGNFSWMQDLFALSSALATVAMLWAGKKKAEYDDTKASKCILAYWSFVPILVTFIIVILLSPTQYAVSMVLVSPAITIWTALAFGFIAKDNIPVIRHGLKPVIRGAKVGIENMECPSLNAAFKAHQNKSAEMFYREHLELTNWDIMTAARRLEMKHQDLRYQMTKLNITRKKS